MNRVLSVFVGAVVLLAVVTGVVVARRATPALDPHTPEGSSSSTCRPWSPGTTGSPRT